MARATAAAWAAAWLAFAGPQAVRAQDSPPAARIEVAPLETTVGGRIHAAVTLELPPGVAFEPPELGGGFGPFTVATGGWAAGPEGSNRWIWKGELAAWEVGNLEIPSLAFRVPIEGEARVVRTDPVAVAVRSVLPPETPAAEPLDLAELKPPASIPPDFGPLRKALGVLGVLLGLAAVAWWLHRRYASRFAAVPAPQDPFHRMPPHVWAYGELQRLLDRRLAEEGQVELFYTELARILKRYLGGRYRVELMEHTTEEIVPLLRPAGAPAAAVAESRSLLERCDRVKFARESPPPDACRKAVEAAYRIVDTTKPVEAAAPEATARGAA